MSEAHGREEEREASSCLLRMAHSPPRAGMSSPVPVLLPSLISPLHSNFSVLRLRRKTGAYTRTKTVPLCPCPACAFDLPIQRERNRQQEETTNL